MLLYICEKPSQARDIAKIIGCNQKHDGYLSHYDTIVSWCYGHLVEAAMPEHYCENLTSWRMELLPIVPKEWHSDVKDEAKKQFNVIKKLLKEAKTVVVATDADREGEVIAREILDLCKYSGEIKRLWLSALDDASIKKALQNIKAGKDTENLYYAGLGRQRADWLIGMNLTMAASVLFGKRGEGALSVGRVQTPTLKLVVQRDFTIEQFRPKDYFELTAQFTTTHQQTFSAKWQPLKDMCDDEGYCCDKNKVSAVAIKIKNKQGKVEVFEDKRKEQNAPLCLSLSQLQKLASSRFGYSAQDTLEIAQSLYETHKAATYPRTDCGYLPQSQFAEASGILNNLKKINPTYAELNDQCDLAYQSPVWNDKKITAHHAIIPTQNAHVDLQKMSAEEKSIYDLICRHYLAQFLGPYEYAERRATVRCENELFKATSHTPIKPGWKRALKNLTDQEVKKDEESELMTILPLLKVDETVSHTAEKLLTKQTKPPARFTEGTLIEAMKSIGKMVQDEKLRKILKDTAGIGTEATRAAILETLFKRKYLEKKGKAIFSTVKGRDLIAKLPAAVTDPALTAQWEQALDFIAQGQLQLPTFLQQQEQLLNDMLVALTAAKPSKPTATRRTP